MSSFVPLFTQHSRSWRDNRFVYPVLSRRSKGLSIGVNLNPDKACNFDCIYCSVDRTIMPRGKDRPEVDLDVIRAELDHLLGLAASGEIFRQPPFDQTPEPLRRVNDVAFSGDGEPTSYPQFEMACRLAADAIRRSGLKNTKIVVITNSTLTGRPAIKSALKVLDSVQGEIWAKLDAGTSDYYHLVERTKIPFERVLENILELGRARPIVIQTLFMRIEGQPPSAGEIDAYCDRLRELIAGGCRIKLVQLYTVARAPAEAYVSHLPADRLDAIADQVRQVGVNVETYYGPD